MNLKSILKISKLSLSVLVVAVVAVATAFFLFSNNVTYLLEENYQNKVGLSFVRYSIYFAAIFFLLKKHRKKALPVSVKIMLPILIAFYELFLVHDFLQKVIN